MTEGAMHGPQKAMPTGGGCGVSSFAKRSPWPGAAGSQPQCLQFRLVSDGTLRGSRKPGLCRGAIHGSEQEQQGRVSLLRRVRFLQSFSWSARTSRLGHSWSQAVSRPCGLQTREADCLVHECNWSQGHLTFHDSCFAAWAGVSSRLN